MRGTRCIGVAFASFLIAAAGCSGLAGMGALSQGAFYQLRNADKDLAHGRYVRAARGYDYVIHTESDAVPADVYARRASIFVSQRQDDDGLAWIERIAERVHPRAPAIQEQKVILLLRLARSAEAIALADDVFRVAPDRPLLHKVLGAHYDRWGDEAGMIRHYAAYLRLAPYAPADDLVRVKLGFAYLTRGRFDEAIPPLEVAERAGNPTAAHNARKGLCAAHVGAGRLTKAEPFCVKAVDEVRDSRRHGDLSPVGNLGRVYLRTERASKARTVGEEFARLAPLNKTGWILLGDAELQLGHIAEARAAWEEAARLAPRDASIARRLDGLAE